jgi:hypothetical protein
MVATTRTQSESAVVAVKVVAAGPAEEIVLVRELQQQVLSLLAKQTEVCRPETRRISLKQNTTNSLTTKLLTTN